MVLKSPPSLVTADELLQLSKDEFYGELIRGELVADMPPGMRHEEIVAELIALLLTYVKANGLGRVFGGSGVWTERDPDTVRAPDVQFFDLQRLPLGIAQPVYAQVAPNLAVEIQSPNDSRRKLHDKAIMWLNAGVQLVWVVLPERRSVDVYRPEQPAQTVTDADSLGGEDVLPGFSCSIADFLGPAPQADAPAGR